MYRSETPPPRLDTILPVGLQQFLRNLPQTNIMSSTGRFFVIDPPVQHVPAVRNVIKRALEVTSQGEEDYEFTKLEDPLRFASAWTDASHRVLRPGQSP